MSSNPVLSQDGNITDDDNVVTQKNDINVANFADKEKEILDQARKHIKSLTKRGDRGRAVKNAETSILALPENRSLTRPEREKLVMKTRQWLASHAQIKREKKKTKHWTGRNVLYELKPDVVVSRQKELFESAVQRGESPNGDFIFFQLALSHVWDNLSDEDKESYKVTAERWNLEGPAVEFKSRLAEKYASKKISAFAQEMWTSMGVRILFFVSFKRENGKIACAQLDLNDTLGQGKSYITNNTAFSEAGITSADWVEHNRTYYEPDSEVPALTSFRPRKGLMDLKINKYGEPLLPDPEVIPAGMKRRSFLQNLLRAFLSLHYGLASHKAPKIPWSKFLPVARRCIKAEYMSDEVLEILKEPSELREGDALYILKFLFRKQEETNMDVEPAFRFCRYFTKDGALDRSYGRKLAPEVLKKSSVQQNDKVSAEPSLSRNTKKTNPRPRRKEASKSIRMGLRKTDKRRSSTTNGKESTVSRNNRLSESSAEESSTDESDSDWSDHHTDPLSYNSQSSCHELDYSMSNNGVDVGLIDDEHGNFSSSTNAFSAVMVATENNEVPSPQEDSHAIYDERSSSFQPTNSISTPNHILPELHAKPPLQSLTGVIPESNMSVTIPSQIPPVGSIIRAPLELNIRAPMHFDGVDIDQDGVSTADNSATVAYGKNSSGGIFTHTPIEVNRNQHSFGDAWPMMKDNSVNAVNRNTNSGYMLTGTQAEPQNSTFNVIDGYLESQQHVSRGWFPMDGNSTLFGFANAPSGNTFSHAVEPSTGTSQAFNEGNGIVAHPRFFLNGDSQIQPSENMSIDMVTSEVQNHFPAMSAGVMNFPNTIVNRADNRFPHQADALLPGSNHKLAADSINLPAIIRRKTGYIEQSSIRENVPTALDRFSEANKRMQGSKQPIDDLERQMEVHTKWPEKFKTGNPTAGKRSTDSTLEESLAPKSKRQRKEVTPPPIMTGKRERRETWKQKANGGPVKKGKKKTSKK